MLYQGIFVNDCEGLHSRVNLGVTWVGAACAHGRTVHTGAGAGGVGCPLNVEKAEWSHQQPYLVQQAITWWVGEGG